MPTLFMQYALQGLLTVLICVVFWVFILFRDNINDEERILCLTARHNLERSHWEEDRGRLEERINRLTLENNRLRLALYDDTDPDPAKPEVTS